MGDLPELSATTFLVIEGAFSLAFATFAGAALFFLACRRDVALAYRASVTVCAVVVAIAAYHYFRLFESFAVAYDNDGDIATVTGSVFNEAYRYMDWLITVPLLIVELILVMGLLGDKRRSLLLRLVPASFLMIILGYPGELSSDAGTQWLWWGLAMVPFVYILFVLFSEVSQVITSQPKEVQPLFQMVRLALVVQLDLLPDRLPVPDCLGQHRNGAGVGERGLRGCGPDRESGLWTDYLLDRQEEVRARAGGPRRIRRYGPAGCALTHAA